MQACFLWWKLSFICFLSIAILAQKFSRNFLKLLICEIKSSQNVYFFNCDMNQIKVHWSKVNQNNTKITIESVFVYLYNSIIASATNKLNFSVAISFEAHIVSQTKYIPSYWSSYKKYKQNIFIIDETFKKTSC